MFCAPSIGKPKILTTQHPFSFYQFSENYYNSQPLKRIFSVMRKLNVSSLVQETIRPDYEFLQEIEALEKRLSAKVVKNKLIRITFFNIDIKKYGIDKADNHNCLGSVIFRISFLENGDPIHNIYEAVIKHRRIVNNYIHCFSKYQIKCLDKPFSIRASYFCQQNTKTNVCAHASLKMISHNLKKLNIKPLNYEEINRILKIDHTSPLTNMGEGRGLSVKQIAEILKNTGLEIRGHSYEEKKIPPYEYQQLIYSSIESGFPALLAFHTTNGGAHIVPVIGHTFNDDNWLPKAEKKYFHLGGIKYLRSTDWINNFIIHDDNYGIYFCLPSKYFNTKNLIAIFQVFPKGCKEAPIDIELRAHVFLELFINKITEKRMLKKSAIQNYWFNKLCELTKSNNIVMRTFLIKKAEYIKSLQNKDIDGLNLEAPYINYLKTNLPTFFWISEISFPELFPTNRRKIADIIIDPSKELNKDDILEPLLFLKVPGLLALRKSVKIFIYQTQSKSHTPLIARSIM